MNQKDFPCPCCSGQTYSECCKKYHDGAQPKTALLLMRARFAAYALNIPDYIVQTTHPASSQFSENKFNWKKSISDFAKHTKFNKLEVLDFKEKDTVATVVFTAHITQNEQDATFTEKSYFEKVGNRWYYRGGQLTDGYAPNVVTTGQLRLLPLAYYGDAVLRKKAEPVNTINDDVKKLAEEMIETMDACDGMGLAAPQVHHSIRMFVYRKPLEGEEGSVDLGEPIVCINPKLTKPSDEKWSASEGCLSIPTIRAEVERPLEISLEYIGLDGKTVHKRCKGWEAKVIMHENDHINGVLFIDRMDKNERSKLDPILKKIEKRIHEGKEM